MFNSIVVGTDGSDSAGLALQRACDLAKGMSARLHVVSAYEPLSGVKVQEPGRRPR